MAAGARPAEPGEFTRRAFAAGRFDLSEAEAVADLIASSSKAAHRLAINQMRGSVSKQLESLREQLVELASLLELELDFSEEDLEFASRTHLVLISTVSCPVYERGARKTVATPSSSVLPSGASIVPASDDRKYLRLRRHHMCHIYPTGGRRYSGSTHMRPRCYKYNG